MLQSKPRVWLSGIKKKVIFSQIIYALITHWSSSTKMNRKKFRMTRMMLNGVKILPLGVWRLQMNLPTRTSTRGLSTQVENWV